MRGFTQHARTGRDRQEVDSQGLRVTGFVDERCDDDAEPGNSRERPQCLPRLEMQAGVTKQVLAFRGEAGRGLRRQPRGNRRQPQGMRQRVRLAVQRERHAIGQ